MELDTEMQLNNEQKKQMKQKILATNQLKNTKKFHQHTQFIMRHTIKTR